MVQIVDLERDPSERMIWDSVRGITTKVAEEMLRNRQRKESEARSKAMLDMLKQQDSMYDWKASMDTETGQGTYTMSPKAPSAIDTMKEFMKMQGMGDIRNAEGRQSITSSQINPAQMMSGQAPQSDSSLNAPQKYAWGMTGFDPKTGIPKVGREETTAHKLWYEGEKKKMATRAKQSERRQISKEKAELTKNTILGGGNDLIDMYNASYAEGGAGNALRQGISTQAEKGRLGAGIGDKYAFSSGFEGQVGEMALKMMPLLTGSVRIVQSVFEYLRKSFATRANSPESALVKMQQTIRNIYKMSMAAQRYGYTEEDIQALEANGADGDIKKFTRKLAGYRLTTPEKKELKEILDNMRERHELFQTHIKNKTMTPREIFEYGLTDKESQGTGTTSSGISYEIIEE